MMYLKHLINWWGESSKELPGWRLEGLKEAEGTRESLTYWGGSFSRQKSIQACGGWGTLCVRTKVSWNLCLCPIGAGETVQTQQMGRPTGSRGSHEDLLGDWKRGYWGTSPWPVWVVFSMGQWFRVLGLGRVRAAQPSSRGSSQSPGPA